MATLSCGLCLGVGALGVGEIVVKVALLNGSESCIPGINPDPEIIPCFGDCDDTVRIVPCGAGAFASVEESNLPVSYCCEFEGFMI